MWRLLVLTLIASASAQIPSLGWCPDYLPMANFSIGRFLGTWYEAERYMTISELGRRCVTTKYESMPDGVILVSNEITSSLTGMKRVLDGIVQSIAREGEGRFAVKYTSLVVPYTNDYTILGTDYDNYAVMWSCSGIGPVHTQNAWILTRERVAPSAIMQAAYGVLDKYKVTRAFFVKSNQADCSILSPSLVSAIQNKNIENKGAPDNKTKGKLDVYGLLLQGKNDNNTKTEQKLDAPQEKMAKPSPSEEAKTPLPAPELTMTSSSERKEEKIDMPEEPAKADKLDMIENESKIKMEQEPAQ